MNHFVYRYDDGMYVSIFWLSKQQPKLCATLDDARVFNTKSEATTFARKFRRGQPHMVPAVAGKPVPVLVCRITEL